MMLGNTRLLAVLLAGAALLRGAASNDDSVRQMRLARFVVPEFPAFLSQTGVREGTVVAAIGHDAAGQPVDILILDSTEPRFTEAVREAVRQWRFESPAKPPLPLEAVVPVVRFLFTSGNVAVVPMAITAEGRSRQPVRAGSPIELPNFSHLDSVPRALNQPLPEFPAALKGRAAGGVAIVKFFVDPEGCARVPVAVHATMPEFADAAVAAVAQWRFEPPRIDGRPVTAIETRTFRFGSPDGP